jgi:hypothetical protein
MMTSMAEQRGGWRSSGLRVALWGGLAALLALPAVAMRLGAEGVVWTARDFGTMAVLLGLLGLGIELAVRASASLPYRLGAGLAVLTGFLTIWVNLAVGMIGDEGGAYNLLFLGVVLLALAGSIAARFRPRGMAAAMGAAAAAQFLAAAVGGFGGDLRGGIFSALFALPWLLSAALLRKAAGSGPGADGSGAEGAAVR